MRAAVVSPTPRTDPSPSRSTASPGPPRSSDAPTSERFTCGRRTRTPCRRVSATSDCGDQNPMGCEFNSPAVNAAG